jgi:PAS domain S-box-containing protein
MIWNIFQWRSLKTRTTLFTLGIFVIGLWSLSFYASRELREDMQRLLGEQQSAMVTYVASTINQELHDRLRILEQVAGIISPAIIGNPAALQALLEQRLILKDPFNNGVAVAGVDGTVIAGLPRVAERIGANFMDRDYAIGALKKGKATIGRPVMGKLSNAPGFIMAVPIRDMQGEVIGALAGVTDLGKRNFLDKVTENRYGKSGGYLLVAPQHRLIVTATEKRRIMEVLPDRGIIPGLDRRNDEGDEGTQIFVNPQGVEVLNSSKNIPVAGWYLVALLPTEEAFAPIRAMQQRMLLATIILTLLAGALTWWTVRRQLSPMFAAVETLADLSKSKQPPKPLPITSQDEIGELIGGFNRLLENLGKQQEALRESESTLQEAQAVGRVGSYVFDIPGDVWRSTPMLDVIFGIGADSPHNMAAWIQLLHPDDREQLLAYFDGILAAHQPFDKEYRIIRASDGEVRWVLGWGKAEYAADGSALRMVGSIQDITERKRTEAASEESALKYRLLFERANDGIFLQDGSGFLDCNQRGAEMYGMPREKILGHSLAEFCPEKQPGGRLSFEVVAEKIEAALRGESPKFEWLALRANGSRLDVEIVLTHIEIGGSHCLQAIMRDITERKEAEAERVRLEAQLRESQKMEALGTMAGGVAHDFNNALAMIIGNTELARQDVGPDHPALVSLDEISKASRRAKDLVQQILSFGRRQKLERKATSLALVIVETARLVRATLPAMVSLNVNCEPDAPAVLADAAQIKQILLNLCGNAIQAIQDQGSPGTVEIDLRTHVQSEAVASSKLKAGRYACMAVRDTGPGMDEATRSHLFEPFFTTKPVGKGTGLGLAVVHGIVQAHEATVEVESPPGKGSAFRIYFPAIDAQAEELAQPEGEAVQVDGAGKRVIYIDDEEAIIFLMQRLLERQGFRVSGFTNPREALAAVQANPGGFDLAVTDFNMPGMSGLELASALREIRPDLPIVLASGYITEDLRKRAPAAGVRELIYKPNTVDDLCEAVARYAKAQPVARTSKPA